MTQKHANGPWLLVRYTNVNDARIVKIMSNREYDEHEDPEDLRDPEILCHDIPPKYAAAEAMLEALRCEDAARALPIKEAAAILVKAGWDETGTPLEFLRSQRRAAISRAEGGEA